MDGGESRKPGKEEHRRNKVVDAVNIIEGGNKPLWRYNERDWQWIEMEGKKDRVKDDTSLTKTA